MNSIQAMLLAVPAIPEKPRMPAISAIIKNINAQDNIMLSPPFIHRASIRPIQSVSSYRGIFHRESEFRRPVDALS